MKAHRTSNNIRNGAFATFVAFATCAILAIQKLPKFHKPYNSPAVKLEQEIDTVITVEVLPNLDSETSEPIPLKPKDITSVKDILEKRINSAVPQNASTEIKENTIKIQLPNLVADKLSEVTTLLKTPSMMSVHQVHRNSDTLADKVINGEVVPNHTALPFTKENYKTGEKATKNILINRHSAVTGKDVKVAWVSPQDYSTVCIELSNEGCDKMKKFTKALTANVDKLAIVLDGKVVNYATLNANTLSKHFVINGLNSKKEAESLVKALQNPLEHNIKIIDQTSTPVKAK